MLYFPDLSRAFATNPPARLPTASGATNLAEAFQQIDLFLQLFEKIDPHTGYRFDPWEMTFEAKGVRKKFDLRGAISILNKISPHELRVHDELVSNFSFSTMSRLDSNSTIHLCKNEIDWIALSWELDALINLPCPKIAMVGLQLQFAIKKILTEEPTFAERQAWEQEESVLIRLGEAVKHAGDHIVDRQPLRQALEALSLTSDVIFSKHALSVISALGHEAWTISEVQAMAKEKPEDALALIAFFANVFNENNQPKLAFELFKEAFVKNMLPLGDEKYRSIFIRLYDAMQKSKLKGMHRFFNRIIDRAYLRLQNNSSDSSFVPFFETIASDDDEDAFDSEFFSFLNNASDAQLETITPEEYAALSNIVKTLMASKQDNKAWTFSPIDVYRRFFLLGLKLEHAEEIDFFKGKIESSNPNGLADLFYSLIDPPAEFLFYLEKLIINDPNKYQDTPLPQNLVEAFLKKAAAGDIYLEHAHTIMRMFPKTPSTIWTQLFSATEKCKDKNLSARIYKEFMVDAPKIPSDDLLLCWQKIQESSTTPREIIDLILSPYFSFLKNLWNSNPLYEKALELFQTCLYKLKALSPKEQALLGQQLKDSLKTCEAFLSARDALILKHKLEPHFRALKLPRAIGEKCDIFRSKLQNHLNKSNISSALAEEMNVLVEEISKAPAASWIQPFIALLKVCRANKIGTYNRLLVIESLAHADDQKAFSEAATQFLHILNHPSSLNDRKKTTSKKPRPASQPASNKERLKVAFDRIFSSDRLDPATVEHFMLCLDHQQIGSYFSSEERFNFKNKLKQPARLKELQDLISNSSSSLQSIYSSLDAYINGGAPPLLPLYRLLKPLKKAQLLSDGEEGVFLDIYKLLYHRLNARAVQSPLELDQNLAEKINRLLSRVHERNGSKQSGPIYQFLVEKNICSRKKGEADQPPPLTPEEQKNKEIFENLYQLIVNQTVNFYTGSITKINYFALTQTSFKTLLKTYNMAGDTDTKIDFMLALLEKPFTAIGLASPEQIEISGIVIARFLEFLETIRAGEKKFTAELRRSEQPDGNALLADLKKNKLDKICKSIEGWIHGGLPDSKPIHISMLKILRLWSKERIVIHKGNTPDSNDHSLAFLLETPYLEDMARQEPQTLFQMAAELVQATRLACAAYNKKSYSIEIFKKLTTFYIKIAKFVVFNEPEQADFTKSVATLASLYATNENFENDDGAIYEEIYKLLEGTFCHLRSVSHEIFAPLLGIIQEKATEQNRLRKKAIQRPFFRIHKFLFSQWTSPDPELIKVLDHFEAMVLPHENYLSEENQEIRSRFKNLRRSLEILASSMGDEL